MTRCIVFVLVAFLMVSCAGTYEREAQYIQEEYTPYEGTGTAQICGQAYVSLDGGNQHVASGNNVLLAPVTTYTKEAFEIKVLRGENMVDPDPQAMKFEKHTKTDDEGRFCFADLPAGDYFVVADVILPTSTPEQRRNELAHARASVKAE